MEDESRAGGVCAGAIISPGHSWGCPVVVRAAFCAGGAKLLLHEELVALTDAVLHGQARRANLDALPLARPASARFHQS